MTGPGLVRGVLLLVGVVHLLPLAGVLGGGALARLYGLSVDEPNLLWLLRHRAVLFGLLGALLVAAAFQPAWQGPALGAAAVSVLGLVALAPPHALPALQRVWWIDVALLPLLAWATWAHLQRGPGG